MVGKGDMGARERIERKNSAHGERKNREEGERAW